MGTCAGEFTELGGCPPPATVVCPERPTPRVMTHGWVVGKFVRGPIPTAWLREAFRVGGKSGLAVALAIWFVAGRQGGCTDLAVTTAVLAELGVKGRQVKRRALKAFEAAGLIQVTRKSGVNPRVAILEFIEHPAGAAKTPA